MRGVLAVSALLVSACGDETEAPASPTDSSVSASPSSSDNGTSDPSESLVAHVEGRPDAVVHSPPTPVGDATISVVGVDAGDDGRRIDVLQFEGADWTRVAQLVLPDPSFPIATDARVQSGDVTGDGRAEFLVRVDAASARPGVVLSDHTGSWTLVGMSGDPADVYAAHDPRVVDHRLVTTHNDCDPNCAEGTTTDVTWSYSTDEGTFIADRP